MNKKLVSIAIASVLATGTGPLLADQDNEEATSDAQNYTAIGVGAASGAIVAGPAGLIIGGIMGSLLGRGGADDGSPAAVMATAPDAQLASHGPADEDATMVASSSDGLPRLDSGPSSDADRIKQIIANDLNLTLYFKPGSVDYESFYSQQLSTLSNLMREMPEMQLKLEGYSDRQGKQADNLQLSIARLESVREYFVNNGIDENRIHVRAYGEKNFLSTPGELDSYIFDRRVVVSFERPSRNSESNIAVVKEAPSL